MPDSSGIIWDIEQIHLPDVFGLCPRCGVIFDIDENNVDVLYVCQVCGLPYFVVPITWRDHYWWQWRCRWWRLKFLSSLYPSIKRGTKICIRLLAWLGPPSWWKM